MATIKPADWDDFYKQMAREFLYEDEEYLKDNR